MKRNTFRVVAGLILVGVAWLGWNADLVGRGGGGRGVVVALRRWWRRGGGGGGGGAARPSMGGHAGGGARPSGGASRPRVSARVAT